MSIIDNLRVHPKSIGLTNLNNPGALHASGGRLDMFASHSTQTRPPESGDLPNIFTGFETLFADYCFDSTHRENEVRVIAIINKYDIKLGAFKAGSNPLRTVIYRDLKTGEVGYFDIRRYTSFTNDYGYENVMRSTIQVNDVIAPETELYSSPAKDGDAYKLGVNANVAFITMLDTTEDSLVMSESLAKKLTPLSIETKSITVDLRKYPLNLYGDDDNYRIIPDIGDCVNADGILCAWRPIKKFSAIPDLRPDKLRLVNHLFDHKIYAHPGARVVDIEIYLDSKSDIPPRIYEQLNIYREARLAYWQGIVDAYEKFKHLPISPKLNTLISRAMGYLLAAKRSVPEMGRRPKITLMDNLTQIQLRIDITLAHKVMVNKGFKSTGREGAKGVIVKVRPDHEMPVDEQGFRADICIDPVSVLKRTNIIQLYEQYINRVLKWQAMHLDKFGDAEAQFARCIEILNDINPEYAKVVVKTHPTVNDRIRYVEECKADTIKICIPPGMDNLNKEMVLLLDQKYQTPISPVEFTIMTSTGEKRVKTKVPVCIGTKYIYLLAKYPKPLAPGFGHVNQHHFPIGTKDKNSSPMGTTPIRFGEAESRMFATAIGVKPIIRLRCLYGNSKIGPQTLVEELMHTAEPSTMHQTKISTDELYDHNHAIRIANHMFNTCGINIQESLIPDEEAEMIFNGLKDI